MRPGLFDAGFLVTRYRTEFAMLELPALARHGLISRNRGDENVLTITWLLLATAVSLQSGATLVLGRVERDVTGDGKPEILQVAATGPIENLDPVFTIQSAGRTIYSYKLAPLTLTVGLDGGKRAISLEQHKARLEEFGKSFFDARKFQRPAEFVDDRRVSARLHVSAIPNVIASDQSASETRDGAEIWNEILNSQVTIFRFSPGGDLIVAIGWSERAGRFYRLMDCC